MATTEASGGTTQKTFPEFKVAFDNGIDYLDPGLSYTVQGWSIMLPVHLGLVTYKLVNGPDGATIIPALAKDLPEISSDGMDYKFTLKDGLDVLGRHADQGVATSRARSSAST